MDIVKSTTIYWLWKGDKYNAILANMYSKTCVKLPIKNRQNKDFNDKW